MNAACPPARCDFRHGQLEELSQRCAMLQEQNAAFERQLADAKTMLERKHDWYHAELERVEDEAKRWNRAQVVGAGVVGLAVGGAIVAAAIHYKNKK